ncbi:MAG: hypothetical protein A2016_06320 [Elusimicrobia bacterium GWF2_62_30]|nr:MAG: hypothetical protein A2016_06320 [Elusimicrobia bacterium GWF2_62_30]
MCATLPRAAKQDMAGYGPGRHAIGHTVAALPLGLGAYASLALRDGLPNPYPALSCLPTVVAWRFW